MDSFEDRKLKVFNQLNRLGLATGLVLPLAGLLSNDPLPPIAWLVAFSPAVISGLVLWLNREGHKIFALMAYFTLYPILSSLVYAADMDLGIELFFILYAVLSVFFLPKIWQAVICGSISAVCYLLVFVLNNNYSLYLSSFNFPFYVFNHLLAMFFIFYALYLIKKENTGYQKELLTANLQMQQQKQTLEQQSSRLNDLNNLKNKLFSVIAHDLRTPLYGLKNLFSNIEKYNMPAEEIKWMVPDINQELRFATSLMENLLQWAKSQMQSAAAEPEHLNLGYLTEEVMGQLRLQAVSKSIRVENTLSEVHFAWADREMTNVVLRNLVSNALKFTPKDGHVLLGARDLGNHIEVFVKDNGAGISQSNLHKLEENNFYTTQGTAKEQGTGLGLMLCREFLHRNGGYLTIKSVEGEGSEFAFTLPKGESLNV